MGAVEGFIAGSSSSGGGGVPQPDPAIAAAAAKNSALGDEMAGVARDSMAWNKDQYEQLAPYFKKILDQQVEMGNLSADTAKSQWGHYQSTYLPVEQQLGKDAMTEGSVAQQEAEANQARAAVGDQFDAQRQAQRRDLELRGVNPASPAAVAAGGMSGASQAAAEAGAMNTARNNARMRGIQLRSNVAQLGRSVPSTALSADSNAVTAGSSAVNTGAASMVARNSGVAAAAPWYTGAVNANASGGNLNLGSYDASMKGYQAQMQQQAGMFQGLGQLGGMLGYGALMRGGAGAGAAGGAGVFGSAGAADAIPMMAAVARRGGIVKRMGVKYAITRKGYADGGIVRGPGDGTVDTVPAVIDGQQPAALANGEGVLNVEATKLVGEKFVHNINAAALRLRSIRSGVRMGGAYA
jgi:hypothetical protein